MKTMERERMPIRLETKPDFGPGDKVVELGPDDLPRSEVWEVIGMDLKEGVAVVQKKLDPEEGKLESKKFYGSNTVEMLTDTKSIKRLRKASDVTVPKELENPATQEEITEMAEQLPDMFEKTIELRLPSTSEAVKEEFLADPGMLKESYVGKRITLPGGAEPLMISDITFDEGLDEVVFHFYNEKTGVETKTTVSDLEELSKQ